MYYTRELPRDILVYFTHGHSAKAQTSLPHLAVSCPIVKLMRLCVPVTAFVQNCRPRGSDVNTKGSDTLVGQLRKAGMYPAFIYLSIFLIFYSILFFILFFFC